MDLVRENHRLMLLTVWTTLNERTFVTWAHGNYLEHPQQWLIGRRFLNLPSSVTQRAPSWYQTKVPRYWKIANPPAQGQQVEI